MSDIEELFSVFDDPKDKLAQLMDIAKESEGIPFNQRTEETRVYGCASQAWVIGRKIGNNYVFRCDSDALIVKGLLSLLCKIFSGHQAIEIHSLDHSKILNLVWTSYLPRHDPAIPIRDPCQSKLESNWRNLREQCLQSLNLHPIRQ